MGENFLTKKKEEKEKKILEVRPQKSNVECESQRSLQKEVKSETNFL